MNPIQQASERYLLLAIVLFGIATIPGLFNAASVASPQSESTAGDPKHGEELFQKRCGACHSLDKEKQGPRLRGVFGRRAGTIPTFTYSNALKAANLTWDTESLNRWLADTDTFIPDNDMNMSFRNSSERADIISYLKQLSSH